MFAIVYGPSRAAVLQLWVVTPLEVEGPFHRGLTSALLHTTYIHYNSEQYKNYNY